MLDQGVEPVIVEMTAYFPGVTNGMPSTPRRFHLLRTLLW